MSHLVYDYNKVGNAAQAGQKAISSCSATHALKCEGPCKYHSCEVVTRSQCLHQGKHLHLAPVELVCQVILACSDTPLRFVKALCVLYLTSLFGR